MAHLFKFGNSAFDLDAVVAVDNDRVVFRDGHSERFSKAGIAALLAALPEWQGSKGAGTPAAKKSLTRKRGP